MENNEPKNISRREFLKYIILGGGSILITRSNDSSKTYESKTVEDKYPYLGITSPIFGLSTKVESPKGFFLRSAAIEEIIRKFLEECLGNKVSVECLFTNDNENRKIAVAYPDKKALRVFLEPYNHPMDSFKYTPLQDPDKTLTSLFIQGRLIHELWHLFNPFSPFSKDEEKGKKYLSALNAFFQQDRNLKSVLNILLGYSSEEERFVARPNSTVLKYIYHIAEYINSRSYATPESIEALYSYIPSDRREFAENIGVFLGYLRELAVSGIEDRNLSLLYQRFWDEFFALVFQLRWIEYKPLQEDINNIYDFISTIDPNSLPPIDQMKNLLAKHIQNNMPKIEEHRLVSDYDKRNLRSFSKR